jgi:hypothetical protein
MLPLLYRLDHSPLSSGSHHPSIVKFDRPSQQKDSSPGHGKHHSPFAIRHLPFAIRYLSHCCMPRDGRDAIAKAFVAMLLLGLLH